MINFNLIYLNKAEYIKLMSIRVNNVFYSFIYIINDLNLLQLLILSVVYLKILIITN